MSRYFVLMCMSVLFLAGCETSSNNIYYNNPEVRYKSITESSYDAVDELVRRAGKQVTRDTPMLIGTIGHINTLEESTPFGRAVSEQIATRLVQKGYKINEIKLRQSINVQDGVGASNKAGEFFLSRNINAIGGEQKAAIVVTGTYAPASDHAIVSLRMIDVKTGRILAATDTQMAMTKDVAILLGHSGRDSLFSGSMAY